MVAMAKKSNNREKMYALMVVKVVTQATLGAYSSLI